LRTLSSRKALNDVKGDNFFEGEIFSAAFGTLVSLGCISVNRIATVNIEEAIRKDWHMRLAEIHSKSDFLQTNSWVVSYRYWRGFVQREARMPQVSENTKRVKAFLVHGFGGSIDQFTGLAQKLSTEFDVYALDSLGFGQSEKPPISYNQYIPSIPFFSNAILILHTLVVLFLFVLRYLWRDQLVDFIRQNSKKDDPIVLCGNSIGGFTAASAAALLEKDLSYSNVGVVLMNSAGKILDDRGISVCLTFHRSAYMY